MGAWCGVRGHDPYQHEGGTGAVWEPMMLEVGGMVN